MKSKNIHRKVSGIVLLAAVFALFLTSCDKLNAPYYTVKSGGDTTKITRKVLLEDYTGQKCPNCPTAAVTASALQDAYNGRLIVMAVHAGFFADSSSSGDFTANYKTPAGNDWNDYFEFASYPNGLVDRKPFKGAVIVGADQWAEAVDSVIILPPEASIKITNVYDDPTRHLAITVDTRFLALLAGTYNLTVCILEDSIISPQKNSDPNVGTTPIIHDYVFMHMMRGSLNGTWGDELTSDIEDTTVTVTKDYEITLNTKWVPKNCSVLAFVQNAGTKEIIQAEKKKILP
ncbi:MAG TPA: Omp28 family outer membrane lipoprotein [Bacteroidales bacterium]|nr:Omp28 family outer membrane lipoprotein [Bacteroidales bacterium]